MAEELLLSYWEYEKRSRRKYDHEVIAYQIRQPFRLGEVTAEEANRIGYETTTDYIIEVERVLKEMLVMFEF